MHKIMNKKIASSQKVSSLISGNILEKKIIIWCLDKFFYYYNWFDNIVIITL